jgi:DNA-binding NarL/FixJ family response regulator
VVALDNALPDGAGVELIGDVRSSNPEASVLLLSDAPDSANSGAALEAGADALLSKVESPFTIIDEIKHLADTS